MASGTGARVKHLLRRSPALYSTAATAATLVRYVRGRPHERDFEVFRHLTQPVCLADVGANHGQSALSFASVSRLPHRIVSFDANTRNEPYLKLVGRLLGSRYEYHLCGLGQAPSTATFYVPVQGRRRITGEGSFRRSSVDEAADRIDGSFEIEEQAFEIRRLDSFGFEPDIVKIDVQGLELEVVIGMGSMLDAAPLLMVEASETNDVAVEQHLHAYGYVPHRAVESTGLLSAAPQPGRPLNWFYAAPKTADHLPTLFE